MKTHVLGSVSAIVMTACWWWLVGACVVPDVDEPELATVIASWDPGGCGPPHRVALELEGFDGSRRSASTWCDSGQLAISTPSFGTYYGRIYAWDAGVTRSVMAIRLNVDAEIVRWYVATPP